jgi:predicted proteasome-type protease
VAMIEDISAFRKVMAFGQVGDTLLLFGKLHLSNWN